MVCFLDLDYIKPGDPPIRENGRYTFVGADSDDEAERHSNAIIKSLEKDGWVILYADLREWVSKPYWPEGFTMRDIFSKSHNGVALAKKVSEWLRSGASD